MIWTSQRSSPSNWLRSLNNQLRRKRQCLRRSHALSLSLTTCGREHRSRLRTSRSKKRRSPESQSSLITCARVANLKQSLWRVMKETSRRRSLACPNYLSCVRVKSKVPLAASSRNRPCRVLKQTLHRSKESRSLRLCFQSNRKPKTHMPETRI